jgi:hypothetical protein
MAKILTIYCEGKKGSHDFDLLEKIIADIAVTIKPIGGKRGAKAIIEFAETGTVKSDYYLFFRDRDFDCAVSEKEELTIDKKIHFSHRTTIENYLKLFDEKFFNDLKFLIYFQGKDFAKVLTNKLPEFPLKNYYKYAKQNFDYTKFADLVQLKKIVESKK